MHNSITPSSEHRVVLEEQEGGTARLEWRLMEAITKEKPQNKDMKFKWSLLWNRIKRQNEIRCTSMRKNRRLGGLFK
ncbi:24138_t:CDS:2, partial [Gigaspora rosea]